MASQVVLTSSLVVVILVALSSHIYADSPSGPNTEEYIVTVVVRQQKCVMVEECYHDHWDWGRWKCDKKGESCALVDVSEARTARRCKSGWTGESCSIAVCDPPCLDGRVCKRPPRSCECLQESCLNTACNHIDDCYPGTCVYPAPDQPGACRCFPGFSGHNCQTAEIFPRIRECNVQIYKGAHLVSTCECYPESFPALTQWMSTTSPTRILVRWRTEFNSQSLGLPDVLYVRNAPISVGIADTHFVVDMSRRSTAKQFCVQEEYSKPHSFKDCIVDVAWSTLAIQTSLFNGAQFNVSILAKTGAEKTGNRQHPNGVFNAKQITAYKPVRFYTPFQVDENPPTHCLLNGTSNAHCRCFPILLEQDFTADAVIEPLVCGWSDTTSGISRFHVKVYIMQPGGDGTLQEIGEALHSEDIIPPYIRFRFTCVQSGVYSIHLTVFDRANNSARARKLLNYDGDSKWTVDQTVKVRIANANPSTNYTWINNLPAPQNGFYRLTLTWAGRYKTNAKYEDVWLKAAKPWTGCTASSNCIDDIYRGRFGLRTIDKVVNMSSLLTYRVVHKTHQNGGIGVIGEPEQDTPPVNAEQAILQIPEAELQEGSSVIVWFTAQDMTYNSEQMRLVFHYDQSSPSAKDAKLVAETDDVFMSRLCINVTDPQSGIKEIRYSIYDRKLRQTIHAATEPSVPLSVENADAPGSSDSRNIFNVCPRSGDDSCYCIPGDECFTIEQCANIDNCLFDFYTKDPLEFKFVIINRAGLNVSGTFTPSAELLGEVRCRPSDAMSIGAKVSTLVAFVILGLVVIILATCMLWRWKKYDDPLPPRLRTMYNRTFRSRNNQRNLNVRVDAGAAYHKNVDAVEAHGVTLEKNVIVSKYQQQSCDAPKVQNDRMDIEYGTVAEVSPLTVSARQVTAQKTLAEGKFAVVKSGQLTHDNECVPIAVKMLRRGFSLEDKTLMEQKINCLCSISYHANIVKFIASYDGGIEGPAMVLELCDMTMSDWLTKNAVTVDTLEEILGFVMDIARGVEHLHSRHVVHRRLAVRNVLLKSQMSGLMAKLIGFGPCDEDIQVGAKNDVTRPLRWLAPETLNTLKSKNPTYDNKTDSWCFGVTVWEMYSKGEKPYPENETKEIKQLLQRGYRMPCPKDCPPELFKSVVVSCWDAVPRNRPEFSDICSMLAKFRSSGGRADYYDAEHADAPADGIEYLNSTDYAVDG